MPDFRPPDRGTGVGDTQPSKVFSDEGGDKEPPAGEGSAATEEEGKTATASEPAQTAGDGHTELKPGILIRLRGLTARPDMNGQRGRLVRFDPEKERWQVKFGDGSKLLKAENLEPCPAEARKPTVTKAEELSRAQANRKELPTHPLSPDEAVEWILSAGDEFEAMLLPLKLEEDNARVRKQYKMLSLLVHPDKNKNPKAELAFKRLFGAMQRLCDPNEQRAAFKRAREQLGYNDAAGDAKAWWNQATVDEMEKAFREMEKSMEKMGFFGGPGLTEDALWSAPESAHQLYQAGLAIFLDARDTADFEVSHITGALSLPGHTMEQLRDVQNTQAFRVVVTNSTKTVVVYSDNGSKLSRCVNVARSVRARLPPMPQRVMRLAGGLNAWKRHGFPVEGDARALFAGQVLGSSMPRLGS